MPKTDKNPNIEQRELNGKKCLFFTFNGIFTHGDAASSIVEWKQLVDSNHAEKMVLIWECLEMRNYEEKARSVWQKTIIEMNDSIEMIWLITDSVLIQAGAEIISFFTSYNIRIVKSEKELLRQMTLKS